MGCYVTGRARHTTLEPDNLRGSRRWLLWRSGEGSGESWPDWHLCAQFGVPKVDEAPKLLTAKETALVHTRPSPRNLFVNITTFISHFNHPVP